VTGGGASDATQGEVSAGDAAGRNERHFPTLAALLSRVLGAATRDTLDVAVETCLDHLGRFTGADMAFTLLIDDDERMSHIWRWVRPGASYEGPGVGTPIGQLFGSSIELLRLGHTIVVNDLDRIEVSPFERAAARVNDLRSILIAPARLHQRLLGVCGLEVYHEPVDWERSCVDQVELLAELLVQGAGRTLDRGALALADARARRIAEFVPDGLALLDLDGVVQWASPSLARMTGVSASRLVGRPATDLVQPADRDQLANALARSGSEPERLVVRSWGAGEWRWSELTWRVVSEPDEGVPDEIVLSIRDQHQNYLEYMALSARAQHDELTGAANRAGLDRSLAELAERGAEVLYLFCDLDGFKAVNDTLGHDAGDGLLAAVADALRSALRSDDVVARVGGDEFAIVVAAPGDAGTLGDRLLEAVRSARHGGRRAGDSAAPTAGDPEVAVSVSIGIAGPAPASDEGLRLLADQAMYEAKRLGKDCWVHLGTDGSRASSRPG
jgi:diguanylate cyclase (GGDEF)-like protein/PAS domain S-box-containing protein